MIERLEIIQFTKDVVVPDLNFSSRGIYISGSYTDAKRWKEGDEVDLYAVDDTLEPTEPREFNKDGVNYILRQSDFISDITEMYNSILDLYPRKERILRGSLFLRDDRRQLRYLKQEANKRLAHPPFLTDSDLEKFQQKARKEIGEALNKLKKYSGNRNDLLSKLQQELSCYYWGFQNKWRPRNRLFSQVVRRERSELANIWYDLSRKREDSELLSDNERVELLTRGYKDLRKIVGSTLPPKSILIER
jgi:hypothetical protein